MFDEYSKNHIDLYNKYISVGEKKFYRNMLVYYLNKLMLIEKNEYKGISPEIELLEYYDYFVILYRRQGEENILQLAKLIRKIAHKIYRIMLNKSLTERNSKFLNLV